MHVPPGYGENVRDVMTTTTVKHQLPEIQIPGTTKPATKINFGANGF